MRRIDMTRTSPAAIKGLRTAQIAVQAPPAPETVLRLPEVGSEAETALVERLARAMAQTGYSNEYDAYDMTADGGRRIFNRYAAAALAVLRGMGE